MWEDFRQGILESLFDEDEDELSSEFDFDNLDV